MILLLAIKKNSVYSDASYISVREVGSSLTTYCIVSSKKSLTAPEVNFYEVEYGGTSISAEFNPEEESN